MCAQCSEMICRIQFPKTTRNGKQKINCCSRVYRLHRVAAIFSKLEQNAAKEDFAGSSLRFPE